MQMAVDRKQLDLKSGEQKVLDLRVKLNTANNNREYQALLGANRRRRNGRQRALR